MGLDGKFPLENFGHHCGLGACCMLRTATAHQHWQTEAMGEHGAVTEPEQGSINCGIATIFRRFPVQPATEHDDSLGAVRTLQHRPGP